MGNWDITVGMVEIVEIWGMESVHAYLDILGKRKLNGIFTANESTCRYKPRPYVPWSKDRLYTVPFERW